VAEARPQLRGERLSFELRHARAVRPSRHCPPGARRHAGAPEPGGKRTDPRSLPEPIARGEKRRP